MRKAISHIIVHGSWTPTCVSGYNDKIDYDEKPISKGLIPVKVVFQTSYLEKVAQRSA